MEVIAMPNDYLMFVFENDEDLDYVMSNPWFFRSLDTLLTIYLDD